MSDARFLVATQRPWQIAAYERRVPDLPGTWMRISDPKDLTPETVEAFAPDRIFFPHWSARIPAAIHEGWECILFHMTDLPYGRGGSPLQNLIERGHDETVLTALRVVEELDAGPVYLKRPLSLAGRARDIFERTADLTWDMIEEIVRTDPKPAPQTGEPVIFTRRKPEQSRLPEAGELRTLYDHIRMLDAEGYPPAFLEHGAFRLEFSNADLQDGTLKAEIRIRRRDGDGEDGTK